MHIPLLSFCIPWICCVEVSWEVVLVITVPSFVMIRYSILKMTYDLTRAKLESCRQGAIWQVEHGLPELKREAAAQDPEIDHDSEWASAYSVAVDRWVCSFTELFSAHLRASDLVSICFALDALDRNWPWKTAEVRKAEAR